MKIVVLWVFCLFVSFTYGQNSGLEVGAELNSGFSIKDALPFWATANRHGTIPSSNYGSLNAYIGSAFQNPTSNWDVAYKGSFSGYLAEENVAFVNELYASVRFRGIKLTAGNRYDAEKWQGLSSSNGNFVKSINARTMPGINFETNGFVTVGFWKKWFSVKANYAEYWMNDDRIVEGAHAHNKSLHFKFKTSEKFSFSIGLDDWAQWGGDSPVYGQQPEDIKSYFKMVFGGSGGDNASESDQVNALGNHIGNYAIELNHKGVKFDWNFYWSHPFEDGSGRELQNWPDAIYGLAFDFKEKNTLVNYVVAEVTYTKNVSGPSPHYTDDDGVYHAARGRDKYFYNDIYSSGWSYFGRTIGTPYIITEVDENGIATGPDLSYNRFLAINIGTNGFLQKVPYRFLLSYIHYYPWFDETFETTQYQFSGFAEFDISPVLKWPVNIELGTSFDLGSRLPNNFGGFIRLSKNVRFN